MTELRLGFPTDISDGLYASEIMDENNGPIAVQSSRVFWDKENTIQLDNAHNRKGIECFYDKIKDVESRVCEQISKNSETWFGTELEFGVVQNSLFNTALKVPTRFNEPFSMYVDSSENISLYDAKKRPRTVEDVVGEVTVLLHAKRVVLSPDGHGSMSAHIDWEILQVLIHKKKSVIKLSELTIQEEPEEHVPVELFSKKKSKKVSKPVVEKVEKVEEPVVENEPEELVVEEVVREPVVEPVESGKTKQRSCEDKVVETAPVAQEVEEEFEVEEVGELEPTPAKFVLEE